MRHREPPGPPHETFVHVGETTFILPKRLRETEAVLYGKKAFTIHYSSRSDPPDDPSGLSTVSHHVWVDRRDPPYLRRNTRSRCQLAHRGTHNHLGHQHVHGSDDERYALPPSAALVGSEKRNDNFFGGTRHHNPLKKERWRPAA